MSLRAPESNAATEGRVLSSAIGRVADLWQLTNAELAAIVGISPATASRLRSGAYVLTRGSKPFELAQFLVRLFRSVDALMGSDDEAAASWLRSANVDVEGKPIELIQTIRGLTEITNYVDDFRAAV
jgi:uncharacterized protein (DUF2384 family)